MTHSRWRDGGPFRERGRVGVSVLAAGVACWWRGGVEHAVLGGSFGFGQEVAQPDVSS